MGGVLNRVVKIYIFIFIIHDGEVSNMGAVMKPHSRADTAVAEPLRVLLTVPSICWSEGEVLPED